MSFLAGLSLNKAPEFELWLLAERTRLQQLYEGGLTEIIRRLVRQEALYGRHPLRQTAHSK